MAEVAVTGAMDILLFQCLMLFPRADRRVFDRGQYDRSLSVWIRTISQNETKIAFDKMARSVFCWPCNLLNLPAAAPACRPVGRFGGPGNLIGAGFWLLSSASALVKGIIIPIDGGFSAHSGV